MFNWKETKIDWSIENLLNFHFWKFDDNSIDFQLKLNRKSIDFSFWKIYENSIDFQLKINRKWKDSQLKIGRNFIQTLLKIKIFLDFAENENRKEVQFFQVNKGGQGVAPKNSW